MNITIGWNCWSNYEDVLLGSEILKQLNKENIFDKLEIIAHSGYNEPPSEQQQTYLNKFYKITTILDKKENINVNKILAPARIFNGYKIAYKHALNNKCDYAIVTNADSWFLSLKKLKILLNDTRVLNSCISTRVGKLTYLFSEYGSYTNFYDDHFFIINVRNCKKYNVFDFTKYDFSDCLYMGGIDYQISKFINIKIPKEKHFIYSDMSKSTNHYGFKSNSSLLPYTYDDEFEFIHANVAIDDYLHSLRAKILKEKSLNKMKYTNDYVNKYLVNKNIFSIKKNNIFFKKPLLLSIRIIIYLFLRRILYFFLRNFFYNKKNKILKLYLKEYNPLENYSKYIKIPSAKFAQIKKAK